MSCISSARGAREYAFDLAAVGLKAGAVMHLYSRSEVRNVRRAAFKAALAVGGQRLTYDLASGPSTR